MQPIFLPEGDSFVYLAPEGDRHTLYRATPSSETGEPLLETARAVTFARHPRTARWHISIATLAAAYVN